MVAAGFLIITTFVTAQVRKSPTLNRQMAVTFDDLPKVIPQPVRPEDTNQTYLSILRIINILHSHRAPASGFVVGISVERNDRAANVAMLRLWVNAGLTLGNHSYSHPSLCESVGDTFSRDVERGYEVLRELSGGIPSRYFRYPYLCTGRTLAEKQGFEEFLKRKGWVNAPVTIEPGDYIFNELYLAARKVNDAALQQRIRTEYIARIRELLGYFEGVSGDLFGREVPQIILFHSNDLNADCLDDVLRLIEQRGYRFVRLDQALADPAYHTPDQYVGTMGISWLHRWKVALGKPLDYSTEPRIPAWVVYREQMLHESH